MNLLGQCFWSAPRVWIMVVRGGETAVSGPVTTGDHEPPGVSTHIMQTSAAELATADTHCSHQMWDWRLQRNLRPRSDLCEQLRAPGKEATVGPGHCRQVSSCCGDIASLCRGLPVTGALWHQPAVSELRAKNNTNIIDPLYYDLNIEHLLALFVGLLNRQRCGWV